FLASSFCRLISWLHLFSGFILLQMLVSLILISCLILFLFLSFYSFFLA
ncbi:Os03g0421300, partial [Oryza sativa Japonica Group]